MKLLYDIFQFIINITYDKQHMQEYIISQNRSFVMERVVRRLKWA